MGIRTGGLNLKRNRHGRWVLSVEGTELPPFLTLPFLCIGLYFLVGLAQNWLDRPDPEQAVETTLSIEEPERMGARAGRVRSQSKEWVWIRVEGRTYRCAGKGVGVSVLYERDDPSKCRAASVMSRLFTHEIVSLLLGSLLTGFGLAGLMLTPSWYRRRQNLYDGILEDEEE